MIRIRLFIALIVVLALVKHFEQPSKPTPTPDPPGPISSAKVLIFEETSPNPKYTDAQSLALASARIGDIREWMDKSFGEGSNHVWDKDLDVSKQDKVWQDAFNKKPETLPWVRYYNGRRWNSGQTFADSAELKKAIGMK